MALKTLVFVVVVGQNDDASILSRQHGGPEEDRTLDLRIANAALSQLSYGPI